MDLNIDDAEDQREFFQTISPTKAAKMKTLGGRMNRKSRIASMVKHAENFRPTTVSLPKLTYLEE